jgi:trigger factor
MQETQIVPRIVSATGSATGSADPIPQVIPEVVGDAANKYPIVKIIAEPEYCKLKVHYEADSYIVAEKVDEAVAECRKLKVSGFRPGKAPDYAIKNRLKAQINQYVVRTMAVHAMDDIIFETNIKPIGQPQFSEIKVGNKNFSCDVEVTKKPDFELGNIKFEVAKPAQETDEEALAEKALYNLRMVVGDVQPYEEDDFVEEHDQITFSFTGTIEGEPFDGSVVEGEMYTVGANRWIGFDKNLIGMKAEEVREFDFQFVDGPLEGKTARFSLTVHMGTKRKPHPLDEEFFKKMGVSSAEEMLNQLRETSKASLKREQQMEIRNQVALKLIDSHKFEIPKFIIEEEAKYIASQSGLSFTTMADGDKTKYLDQAERNARLSLILDSIRESEPDSVLNEMEARNVLTNHIQSKGGDPNRVLNNPAMAAMLLNNIKDEFTLQWVSEQATIIE